MISTEARRRAVHINIMAILRYIRAKGGTVKAAAAASKTTSLSKMVLNLLSGALWRWHTDSPKLMRKTKRALKPHRLRHQQFEALHQCGLAQLLPPAFVAADIRLVWSTAEGLFRAFWPLNGLDF